MIKTQEAESQTFYYLLNVFKRRECNFACTFLGHPLHGELLGVCIQSDGTWKTISATERADLICEIPGFYLCITSLKKSVGLVAGGVAGRFISENCSHNEPVVIPKKTPKDHDICLNG